MNTEIDMGKLNDWLEQVRNTFINASELAGKVAGMQAQVNEMSLTLDGLRQLNRTLDENLSWSRSERDRLETANQQQQESLRAQAAKLGQLESEYDRTKQLADERASIIATLKSDNDTIAFRNLELEEENVKLKGMINSIQIALHPLQVIGAAGTGQTQVVEAPKAEPQPRDPVTQQWRPKAAYYDDDGQYHPEQTDDPSLPKTTSGF